MFGEDELKEGEEEEAKSSRRQVPQVSHRPWHLYAPEAEDSLIIPLDRFMVGKQLFITISLVNRL